MFDRTVDQACATLGLSARAAAALVAEGAIGALLLPSGRVAPGLDLVRLRGDQVDRMALAPGELARVRERFPASAREFDRASALGSLLSTLGR